MGYGDVKATALNHHDVWSLRGVGLPADRLPMILGCDAAGIDSDGNEVAVHAVLGDPDAGDETLDPRRSLLSERYNGTFAEKVCVPRRNLVSKPASLSFEEAACRPAAYLTAYRMLFTKSGVQPGTTILIQGASGGVATALILIGWAAGYRMWVLTRIFFTQLSVVGSAMGIRQEFGRLLRFCEQTGTRALIDRVLPLRDAPADFAAMIDGAHNGKIVFVS